MNRPMMLPKRSNLFCGTFHLRFVYKETDATLLAVSAFKSKALLQGGKVAKQSFLVQLLLGITEVSTGIFTLSVALMVDGMQSFADAGVSLIVWMGFTCFEPRTGWKISIRVLPF
jgi:hypothetical protein